MEDGALTLAVPALAVLLIMLTSRVIILTFHSTTIPVHAIGFLQV
jgi:hypothetical protein